jgi:hypothetical protein
VGPVAGAEVCVTLIVADATSAIMPGMARFAEVTVDTVVIDPPVGKTGKVFADPSDLTPCK